MTHPYIGFLEINDQIKTTLEDGEELTVTIKRICVDPIREDVFIYAHHSFKDTEVCLNLSNLSFWFKDKTWVKVSNDNSE